MPTSMAGAERLPWVEATIDKVTQLSPRVLGLRVAAPADFTWEAGQHLPIAGPDETVGYYSIASAPSDDSPGEFELAVAADSLPFGQEVRSGLRVLIGRPAGALPLRKLERVDEVVLIGMGTGVAPLRATVQFLLREQDNARSRPHIVLLQGARTEDECYFRAEFEALESERFSYRPVFSQPRGEGHLRLGRVQAHLEDLPTERVEYCLCGSADMVKEVRRLLNRRGISDECIYSEGH